MDFCGEAWAQHRICIQKLATLRAILLMAEILHHLGCMKPYKEWDIYHINWLAGFLPSTVGIQSPCQRMIFGWFFFITSRNTHRSFIGSMTPFSVSVIGCLLIYRKMRWLLQLDDCDIPFNGKCMEILVFFKRFGLQMVVRGLGRGFNYLKHTGQIGSFPQVEMSSHEQQKSQFLKPPLP